MAFSSRLVPPLLQGMHSIAGELGTDVMLIPTEAYRVNLEILSLIAMTLQIIQDLAPTVLTDDVLAQRLAIAVDTGPNGDRSGWPGWAILQVRTEDLAMYGATTSDTVASLQAKIAAYNAANFGSTR